MRRIALRCKQAPDSLSLSLYLLLIKPCRKLPTSNFWASRPEHLSVYQTSPKLWEREAFEEKLDGAPEATGEPGKFSAGELGRLTVRVFFSAGAGLLAWSHMPVETAQ